MHSDQDDSDQSFEDSKVLKSQDDLKIALHAILPRDEYFLDYLTVTAKGVDLLTQQILNNARQENDPDEVDNDVLEEARESAIYNQAFAAVGQARMAFRRLDVPFFLPPGFSSEMFRTDEVMNRVEGQRKAIEDAKLAKERTRNLRLQRKLNKQLKHEKNKSKIQSEKAQKEVIKRWKEERIQLKKQGVAEENLPTLEDAEKQYIRERKKRRIGKNIKYSGRKDFNRKYSERKKNDPITLDRDNFVYRQFSQHRKSDDSGVNTKTTRRRARLS